MSTNNTNNTSTVTIGPTGNIGAQGPSGTVLGVVTGILSNGIGAGGGNSGHYANNIMNGINWVTPPVIGQAYYDQTSGNTMIYTNNGWTQFSGNSATISKPKTTFVANDGRSVTVDDIVDFMDIMKRRMLILTPDLAKHEHFPALKEAYEQYLVLDKLMNENHNPEVWV